MPMFQVKNKKTGHWVKYKLYGGKSKIVGSKKTKWKGVKVR